MEPAQSDRRREFRSGFVATMPLWLADVPFAVAYALLAQTNGFSKLEALSMSMIVFAGSAQLAIIDMAPTEAGYLAILLTVLLLNLRHVLYALTLDIKLARPRSIPKPVLAAGMTDESMGLTIGHMQQKPATDWYFMGTVVSLYSSFTVATFIGVFLGGRIPDAERFHFDVIFPLTFLALLLPLMRTRRSLTIAVVAAGLSIGLRPVVGASNSVLIAILAGAAVGLFLPSTSVHTDPLPSEDLPR
ncbi:MAG: AzlC family ABC transporter permease [Thermomicrobiales bacterium]|nr:AzlC family ABC transporter permease [Thermomicrobiales bacterium]